MAPFELNESAIGRLEAALRVQRNQHALPRAPQDPATSELSSGGVEEPHRDIDALILQSSLSASEALPPPVPMDVHDDHAWDAVQLSATPEIPWLKREASPRKVETLPEVSPAVARLSRRFPMPQYGHYFFEALYILVATGIILTAVQILRPALFPISESKQPVETTASIDLAVPIASKDRSSHTQIANQDSSSSPKRSSQGETLASLPPEQKPRDIANQNSSSVSALSQPKTPASLPLAPSSVPTAPIGEPVRKLDGSEIALLVQQGNQFIAVGDLAAARMVFERAAEAGSAAAALAMGATYDPAVLAKLGVVGMAADVTQARSWYEKAKTFGSPEARQRLELLANE